jgi:uncharacterized protein
MPDSGALNAAQHLAALRWLLLSPPLVVPPDATVPLADMGPAGQAAIAQWLQALQADSTALMAWMQQHPQSRIGRYAEQLLEFYLTHGPQHRLLAAHVPLRAVVNGLKITQGELDFLLVDAQGLHMHWELAVKFFLCTATGTVATPADFIGPNGVETLAHKWHKLFARQLAHTPPVPWDTHTWHQQAFTRGWMFYRWGHAVPHCDALHPQHGKAWWIDFKQMGDLPDASYAYLPRLQWMAPVQSMAQLGADTSLLSRSEMGCHLQAMWASTQRRTDAQMVMQCSATDGQLEVQRFFVRPPRAAQAW